MRLHIYFIGGHCHLISILERLQATWDAPVYAFYSPEVKIGHEKRRGKPPRRFHMFTCARKGCKLDAPIKRYLDTGDARSTGNLRKHVRKCWGEEILKVADDACDADEVRTTLIAGHLRDGSITTHFKRKKGAGVTYSHRQHTKNETR